jgi:uncharacterized protein with HEPN domain
VPFRDWKKRIEDILAAIADIQEWTQDKNQQDLENDVKLARAILYSFVIIGEAAANVPDDIQDQYDDIPWRLMSDMRNVMAHEYFQVDFQIVWSTIQKGLPVIVPKLQDLLKDKVTE